LLCLKPKTARPARSLVTNKKLNYNPKLSSVSPEWLTGSENPKSDNIYYSLASSLLELPPYKDTRRYVKAQNVETVAQSDPVATLSTLSATRPLLTYRQ